MKLAKEIIDPGGLPYKDCGHLGDFWSWESPQTLPAPFTASFEDVNTLKM